ncbi:MAG: nucleotide exchange factor GrpE [Defluviitaleaceae bacterium]|nr:nucleotide exchange factor GrpE [Defluviitaleaceae bacterium]
MNSEELKVNSESQGQEQSQGQNQERGEAGERAQAENEAEAAAVEDANEEDADDLRHKENKKDNMKDKAKETCGEAAPELTESEINQALIAGLTDRLQRNMAEFDNYRKRTAKEKATMYEDGARDAIGRFLPVVDNLERALMTVSSDDDKESQIYKGVEMIFRQAGQILGDMGLEELPGAGEPFDHNYHNAVASEDGEENGEPVVAEVLQKGYKYRDKVVRPGMVKVRR